MLRTVIVLDGCYTGAADSRLAIQQAMDAARDFGDGDVILVGTYRNESSLLPCDNVTLQGPDHHLPTSSNSSSLTQTGRSGADPNAKSFVRDINFCLSDVPNTNEAKALFVAYTRNLRFEYNCSGIGTGTGHGVLRRPSLKATSSSTPSATTSLE